jgi:hypothetical protein
MTIMTGMKRCLVVGAAAATMAGCDPYTPTTCVTVTRCTDADPLVGVKVAPIGDDGSAVGDPDTLFTDPDGRACWYGTPHRRFMVLLDKPSYQSQTVSVTESMETTLCLETATDP